MLGHPSKFLLKNGLEVAPSGVALNQLLTFVKPWHCRFTLDSIYMFFNIETV